MSSTSRSPRIPDSRRAFPEPSLFPDSYGFGPYAIPRNDEFSDLEIRCGKQSFRAHKIVVSERSPILHAALTRDQKKSMDDIYYVQDFHPELVDLMLDFMYTGSYDPVKFSYEATGAKVRGPSMNRAANALFTHLEMNSIGEFYGVSQLRELAIEGIRHLVTSCWYTIIPWYTSFVEVAFKKTSDPRLHWLLVEATSDHFGVLSGRIFFDEASKETAVWFFSAVMERKQRLGTGSEARI